MGSSRKSMIRKNFDYLDGKFGDMPYAARSEFSIGGVVLTTFSRFSTSQLQAYAEAVAKDIMIYLGLPMLTPSVTVNMMELGDGNGIAGTFNGDITRCRIDLNISELYSPMNVYAILAHECTHYFLRFHGAEYEDKDENEILTDCAAVYLGLGRYMFEGYQPIPLENNRYHKIGYISADEVSLLRKLRPCPETPVFDYRHTPEGTAVREKHDAVDTDANRAGTKTRRAGKDAETDSSKKNRRFAYIFAAVLTVAFLVPVVFLISAHRSGNGKEESLYSADMKNGDRAYIFITSCKPKYAITENSIVTKVVCEATTTQNGIMLIAIQNDYETFMKDQAGSKRADGEYYRFNKNSYLGYLYKYTFEVPIRLNCQVKSASDYRQLKSEEGERVILEVNRDNRPNHS